MFSENGRQYGDLQKFYCCQFLLDASKFQISEPEYFIHYSIHQISFFSIHSLRDPLRVVVQELAGPAAREAGPVDGEAPRAALLPARLGAWVEREQNK